MPNTRSNLIERINNLDLGDLTSQYRYRDLMLALYELGGVGFGGDKFYVDAVNGNDSNDGTGPADAKLTLAAGYALLSANNNDMLYIIGGASSLAVPSGFVWAKSYCHLLGLASSLRGGGRARLTHSADFTPIFPITASGCQFSNIHIQHGRGNAANLVNSLITGSRNSFYNVQFEGPLSATEGGAAYRELVIGAGAEANTFINCNIGNWSTVCSQATGREIEFLGLASDTYFQNCLIRCYNSSTSHEMVEASAGLGDENVQVEFDNCRFIQLDNDKILTKAIEGPANGNILLTNCVGVRITAFSGDAKVFEAGNVIAS